MILGNDQVGVQALRGPVRVYSTGNVQVIANDLADATGRDVLLRRKPAQTFDVYSITGLSPYPIDLELAPESFAIVNGSGGDDKFHVEFEQTALKWVLSGGGGRNTVDYSTWTGDAYINLATGQASGLLSLSNIHHAIGGAGNDILVGLGAGILSGGTGLDVLIAGTYDPNGPFGANPVTSLGDGAGQDLLVGGKTDFDTDRDSLLALLALWTANTGYATRASEVSAFLNFHATSNGLTNLLYGGSELDVLFGTGPEFQDLVPGESTFPS